MLRFYVQKIGDMYEILNDANSIINCSFTPEQLNGINSEFAEIRIRPTMPVSVIDNIVEVNEMHVPYIKAEALKAINDHNYFILNGPKDELKEYHSQDLRENMQKIIDRLLQYGVLFQVELDALMDKYPLKEVVISEDVFVVG